MPRIVKHPEQRREELLDCAQAVFLDRGYDNASLNEVIAIAGVSKGAFYHYFASKEALLEALAGRFARAARDRIIEVLDDNPGLDALARLNLFLTKGRQNKMENATTAWTLFASLFRQENRVLFHQINEAGVAQLAPILTDIIRQGVADGVFETFDPEGVADMVLHFGSATYGIVARALAAKNQAGMDEAIHALEQRVRLQEIAIDRILGLPDGSVRLTEPGFIRTVMLAREEPSRPVP